LFSVAVSTVLFPELARRAAQRDLGGVGRIVSDGARTIIFLLLPAAAISIVLAQPLVRLLFQHGEFSASATDAVSLALMAFSLGLVANGLALLLTRGFVRLHRPDVPTKISAVNLVLNAVLDVALLGYGAAGIALSTSIVTAFTAASLAMPRRTRVAALHGREIRRHTVLIAVATLYCAVAAFGV